VADRPKAFDEQTCRCGHDRFRHRDDHHNKGRGNRYDYAGGCTEIGCDCQAFVESGYL